MYLSRLSLNATRTALSWSANPYRVHQRLLLAFSQEPRLLFRVEENGERRQILVQSRSQPDWAAAFAGLHVLQNVEWKPFDLCFASGQVYAFRLLANPTVKRAGSRLGLLHEEDQLDWLARKMSTAGAVVLAGQVRSSHLQHSEKNLAKDSTAQTHLAVLYEGTLRASQPDLLTKAVENGVGSAKGYGFGLLSLAPFLIQ